MILQSFKAVVHRNERPSRPSSLNDEGWNIMVACWQKNPAERSSAPVVAERVAGLKSFKTEFRPAPDWDISDPSRISFDTKALIQLQGNLAVCVLYLQCYRRDEVDL
ncbi:hypothetical protein L218DRAFT_967468 [Marasmius fiardii PR-910]|nr:hypothetical protein L218DRAFT_967468 [Marasmius fiardii PR-910]